MKQTEREMKIKMQNLTGPALRKTVVKYNPREGWPFPKAVPNLTPRQVARRRKQLNKEAIQRVEPAPF